MNSQPKDLRYFLQQIGGDRTLLVRSSKEVSSKWETSALLSNLGAGIGKTNHPEAPALLFENVQRSRIPILCNVFGSRRLLSRALEVEEENIIERLNQARLKPLATSEVHSGPVHDNVYIGREASLSRLPIVTHCELDVAPYITSGLLIVTDPETGRVNMGIYRFMLQGERQLGVALGASTDACRIFKSAERIGRDLEAVIAIGHHPAVYLASQSYDPKVSETCVAGALLGEPIQMTKCRTNDCFVPAYAEISIEGRLKAGIRHPEAPFAEYTGYYADAGPGFVFEVSATTHRSDAIYLDIYNAGVEHVNLYSIAVEALLNRQLRSTFGDAISSLRMPAAGVGHIVYVSVKQPREELVLGIGAASLSAPYVKICVVFNDDINLQDDSQVAWAIATRTDPYHGVSHVTEPKAAESELASKIIIDATRPSDHVTDKVGSPPLETLRRMDPGLFFD